MSSDDTIYGVPTAQTTIVGYFTITLRALSRSQIDMAAAARVR